MPDAILSAIVVKAKTLGGPIVAVLLLGASAGWYAHGERAAANHLAATVARLDSNTVKRSEFDQLVRELRLYAERADSTSALFRRFLCRSQPTICP